MAQYVYTLLSLAMSCSVRREISPCSCDVNHGKIVLTCDGVDSFNRVFDALQNRFNPDLKIQLEVKWSQLEDLETKAFGDMNLRLTNLKLNFDNLKTVPESSFRNLTHLEFLSLAFNNLDAVPRHIFPHTPNLGTLDLGVQQIRRIGADDFRQLPRIEHLMLFRNALTELDSGSLPSTLKTLHLSHNNLTTLNGTLRHMQKLRLVFLNNNRLTTVANELPVFSPNLLNVLLHHNELTHMPADLRTLPHLETLYMRMNRMRSLDGVLRHSRYLEIFEAHTNQIEHLAEDEFADCEKLEFLDLAINRIRSVNGSLLPLKNLRLANFSANLLTDFSLNEIRGLRSLLVLDLSWNQIERLSGKMVNIVEPDLFVIELRLQNNRLKSLDGAMMGMNRLVQLDLSHNLLAMISPDDLIGLEELDVLDISHNMLQTLEETSKSVLPKLTKLNASNNHLTKLDRDFDGLPALCVVDLSNNRIATISPNLVNNTRCISHSVVTKMDIILQDNPVLCRHDLDQLIQLLNAQEARLKGLAHCLVRQEELATPVHDLVITPPPDIVQSMLQNLPDAPTAINVETPAILKATIAQSSDEPTTAILGHNLTEPSAEPLVTTVQPAASLDTLDADTEDSMATTTVAPLTTTMLSNFIQSSHTPLGVHARVATAVAAVESTTSWTPVPTTTLSNIIQSLDDEVPPEPLLQLARGQPADLEAAAFDDIQPSDIVTLPDLPDLSDDLVDHVQATSEISTTEQVNVYGAPELSQLPADPTDPPPPDNSRATADATTQT